MATSIAPSNGTRVTGSTSETLIYSGRCILLALLPNNTTTGTITVRDGGAADGTGATKHVAAIGITQNDLQFGPYGIVMGSGLTVQNSVAGDAVTVVWMPA